MTTITPTTDEYINAGFLQPFALTRGHVQQALVEPDGTIRVWDSAGSIWTARHGLDDETQDRIRAAWREKFGHGYIYARANITVPEFPYWGREDTYYMGAVPVSGRWMLRVDEGRILVWAAPPHQKGGPRWVECLFSSPAEETAIRAAWAAKYEHAAAV